MENVTDSSILNRNVIHQFTVNIDFAFARLCDSRYALYKRSLATSARANDTYVLFILYSEVYDLHRCDLTISLRDIDQSD